MKRQHDAVMSESGAAQIATVLCCSCGMPMAPNQTMRCAQCLKAEVSIIEGISRQCVLSQCRNCNRYNMPPWRSCEPESRELLGLCLKRIKGLGKDVRLVDAAFIWTEEHSKRIKVKITVQKEVANSSVLQQTMVVEFQIAGQQCEECQRSFTPNIYNAMVQVRQKVEHRRTFLYLEQLILKSDAHEKVVSLKETREGLDFHFAQRSHAQRFADYVSACVPSNHKNSKHLISHDTNSNTYSYKYTIMVTLCPVCVDDIIYIPKGHSDKTSGAPPIALCHKVSNCIRLVDPLTLRSWDIGPAEFFKRPINTIATRKHLTEFVVLNVELVDAPEAGTPAKHRLTGRGKMALADIEVARQADFGVNDNRMIVRSHLGAVLKPGHTALGYDLRSCNLNGIDMESVEAQIADIILVRKLYKRNRGKKRQWELRRLKRDKEEGVEDIDDEADMEAMRQDLEEDPELRQGVSLYRTSDEVPAGGKAVDNVREEDDEEDDEEDEDAPEVPLAELLEGLQLRDDDGGVALPPGFSSGGKAA